MSNYASKTGFKNAAGVETSKFAKKVDLASLKCNVDKLDIDELKNVPTNSNNLKSKVDKLDKLDVDKLVPVSVDLSKLSDVVTNEVVKKNVYNAKIKKWESKRLSNKKSKPSFTANKSLSPKLLSNKSRLRLRFEGSCVK